MSSRPRLGVCSWSLQPASPGDLVDKLVAAGARNVQLALDPLRRGDWSEEETTGALAQAGIEVCSGMMETVGEDYSTLDTIRETGGVRPDEHWEANLAAARANAQLARRLGLSLVTLHAGFLPHDPQDPERATLLQRLRSVCDVFGEQGVTVGFETGQETADTLLGVLAELDHPRAGVNFDPANMILYAMGEPVEALRKLAPHVKQIHIKDATRTQTPGTWGAEVPAGTGDVDWEAFFGVVREAGLQVDRMIEREAGEQRVADIRTARELVERIGGAR